MNPKNPISPEMRKIKEQNKKNNPSKNTALYIYTGAIAV